MRWHLKVLAILACVVVLLYLFSGCFGGLLQPSGRLLQPFDELLQSSGGLLQPEAGAGNYGTPLTLGLSNTDVVNLKNSLPEKVLKHLDLGSRSWQNYYHTNCCSDIYITVRTSQQTQESRLPVTITTWMQTVPPNQVC